MPLRRHNRSEDSYIYHDILPTFEEYGYPGRGDTENLKIKGDIRIRIGSRSYTPDVVYYADGVPLLLVEAKKEGMTKKDAEDQAKSYIRNFPVDRYSRDGRPPRYAAVTVGRQVYFYKYAIELSEYGAIKDDLVPQTAIATYQELKQSYGLIIGKPSIDAHTFKVLFYELVSAFDTQNRREVTPQIVLKTVHLIYEFLRDPADYVTRRPYTDLGRHPHIQMMIRSILSQYDWSLLTPDIALRFREIVVRAFQGSKSLNQYITPWPVVRFMAELAELKPRDTVLDFECGSGGFLVAALEKGVPMGNMLGIDIADLPYYVSKVFLALHSNTRGTDLETKIPVLHDNGLLFHGDDWHIVISNPAGGAKYDAYNSLGDIAKVYDHLERDLNADGKDDPASEYYFSVQQAVRSARVGGRICLVLPEGFFSNSSDESLRRYVGKHCRVKAIVSLPRGVFQVGATTRTVESGKRSSSQKMSVLFAEKIREVVDGDGLDVPAGTLEYPVFLASVEKPRDAGQRPNWLQNGLKRVLSEYRIWAQRS